MGNIREKIFYVVFTLLNNIIPLFSLLMFINPASDCHSTENVEAKYCSNMEYKLHKSRSIKLCIFIHIYQDQLNNHNNDILAKYQIDEHHPVDKCKCCHKKKRRYRHIKMTCIVDAVIE